MVIQVGTAEDIVMHPVDDYVADFVAGISRLKVVRAHAVMRPVSEHVAEFGELAVDAARVNESVSLSTLIHMAIDKDGPIAVADGGADVGVITRRDILQTVIDGTEVS
jgi:glycine betaine/proline transport system ATP-binding protein